MKKLITILIIISHFIAIMSLVVGSVIYLISVCKIILFNIFYINIYLYI
jgi:hypothetical protein